MPKVDTRGKIISSAQAGELRAGGATVVSGYFDPLLAWHAQRFDELKRAAPLIAVIETPAQPILPARARAELVASLRAVDYVVESAGGLKADVRLEQEDQQHLNQLIAHVHARREDAS